MFLECHLCVWAVTVSFLRSWLSWRQLCWMISLIGINSRRTTCPPYRCPSHPRTSHADISIRTAPARNYRVCASCVCAFRCVCEIESDLFPVYLCYCLRLILCGNINLVLSSCICVRVFVRVNVRACVHMCRVSSHHWYRVWWWFDEWRWVGAMVFDHRVLLAC